MTGTAQHRSSEPVFGTHGLSDPVTSDRGLSDPVISAHSLHCERSHRVLFSDLSFTLHGGQVLQVGGANGSGKTTLLRIICGLNDDYQGEIHRGGDDWESFLESLLYIGHRPAVNRILTPVENLRWSSRLHPSLNDADVMQALDEAGLRGFEHSRCHALSAGQQRRVSLARLLLSPARLWVLDEPFTTLDGAGVAWLEGLLQRQAERGGAVIVTSHHPLRVPGLTELTLGA